jgi:hypothetical protein
MCGCGQTRPMDQTSRDAKGHGERGVRVIGTVREKRGVENYASGPPRDCHASVAGWLLQIRVPM